MEQKYFDIILFQVVFPIYAAMWIFYFSQID